MNGQNMFFLCFPRKNLTAFYKLQYTQGLICRLGDKPLGIMLCWKCQIRQAKNRAKRASFSVSFPLQELCFKGTGTDMYEY
jgi:hypothetical protein